MYVWTPAGYEKSQDRLPVLYLVHGGGDNDAAWSGVGCAGDILDNLMAEGKMKPMVVVMPNGSIKTENLMDNRHSPKDSSIMPSSRAAVAWAHSSTPKVGNAEAEAKGKELMEKNGYTTLKQLRSAKPEDLLKINAWGFASPHQDGVVLTETFDEAVTANHVADVDYMVGFCLDEMMDYWTNFAKYGHPAGKDGEDWPRFTYSNPYVKTLNIK